MSRLRALVIQHEEEAPGGHLHDWLAARGAEEDVLRIATDTREIEPRDYELIVSLGSEASAFAAIPWIAREEELLRRAARAGVATFGICFGGQLLARALGGECFRAPRPEIGWHELSTRDRSLVPPGPWFQWHFDSFSLPPGASELARSTGGPQAYRFGRSAGIQFHPEVTPEIVEGWMRDDAGALEREGVDTQALVEETRARAAESRDAAWRLFDAMVAGLLLADRERHHAA